VFHTERSATSLKNLQNELPALTDDDKAAVLALADEFDIDFLNVSFCRTAEDIISTREFLQDHGMSTTKVRAQRSVCLSV
jgi:pyruvate kinase